MARERPFRPGFVRAVGSCFVAVDQVQPVAMAVSASGEILDVTSWAEQVAPVATKTRTLASGEDRVFVRDWPTSLSALTGPKTPLATVAVADDGQLSALLGDAVELPVESYRDSRLVYGENTHTLEECQRDWVFRTYLTGVTWHSEALHGTERCVPRPGASRFASRPRPRGGGVRAAGK